MSMDGTQDAAANSMTEGGVIQEKTSPCLFVKDDGSTPTLVHGDDFCATGTRSQLEALKTMLSKTHEIKSELSGPWKGANKSVRMLG